MTVIPRGGTMPKKYITRDISNLAIEALSELPKEHIKELNDINEQLQ